MTRSTYIAGCLGLGLAHGALLQAAGWYEREAWVGDIPPGVHQVTGDATIIDERTIRVDNFTYDGTAPAVYFYLGATNAYDDFLSGLQLQPLLDRAYNDESITLTLPPGETMAGYTAISVWCAAVNVNFSSATFEPAGPLYPRAGWLADIPLGQHEVEGLVTVIDDLHLHVEEFTYDGGGPAVYFYLGATNTYNDFLNGLEVPPELGPYMNGSLVLTLPSGETMDGFGAVSVWCANFDNNFSSAAFEQQVKPGDHDGDGDVDLEDHAVFVDCLAGPGVGPSPAGTSPAACLAAFDGDGDGDVDSPDYGAFQRGFTGATTQTAEYELVFDATWSAQTHPNQFPSGPHFSGLIGGTHNAAVRFWEVGGLATTGIENMAELGSKTALTAEVQAAITAGNAGQVISGPGVSPSPGSASVTFTATKDFPLATVVTMIAPSPDWFVGVAGLPLLVDGLWVDEVTVHLQPYDAGTDSGPSYTSPNADTNPQDPIAELVGSPFVVNGSVAPFGTFTFRRID